jgi:signal transduction histidine kinase
MLSAAGPPGLSAGTQVSPSTHTHQIRPGGPTLVGMTAGRPQGRQLEPIEAFEVTPWRALALYRMATLVYVVVLAVRNMDSYAHPYAAGAVLALMAGWSAATIVGYERARLRAWPLLAADVGVVTACVLASRPVIGAPALTQGTSTLTVAWMACPVLAVAVVKGVRLGIVAAVLIGACDLAVRAAATQSTVTGIVIMITAAAAVGHLGNIGVRAQEQLRRAAALEAAHAERDRLARGIHDSVLQVLALVQRRGEQLGGEAADLGRLAGEQEIALRRLVDPGATTPGPVGLTDLRAPIGQLASARVTVAVPPTAVWLPARIAGEVYAAVVAATDNARQHCPPETRIWILIEDEPEVVTATVRDDGPGIPPGRLEQAASQGRLGVAQSIRGRVAHLGGQVTIVSVPGDGTEVELSVPRPAR